MKATNTTNQPIRNSVSGGLAIMVTFVVICLTGVAMSQSADVFSAKGEEAGEPKTEEKKNVPLPDPVDSLPSRFAGNDTEPYIAARAAVFSMRNRATDPFGLYQDPDAKPVIRKIVSDLPGKRLAALPPTPLSDIVKLIRVTTIMPSEKQFLVGTRSFSEGDEFPLVFQEKTLRMKVVEVTSRRILFKNLDNGEEAALETGMLPPGMIAGGTEMRPPGMVATGEDIPLKLESATSLEPNN